MINIAIDGPAGAGKSTIAKMVAKEMKYIYVDTGALYRAVGLYAVRNNIDTKEVKKVIAFLKNIKVEIKYINKEQRVFLNNEDVSGEIRTEEISRAASGVSDILEVREFLFDTQKNIAKENNVIMDGRDIGTVVLPEADVKIFLTASIEERAERRYKQLIESGKIADIEIVKAEIAKRDNENCSRKIAPLKQAKDAVLVDTTSMSLEESVNIIKRIINERLRRKI